MTIEITKRINCIFDWWISFWTSCGLHFGFSGDLRDVMESVYVWRIQCRIFASLFYVTSSLFSFCNFYKSLKKKQGIMIFQEP